MVNFVIYDKGYLQKVPDINSEVVAAMQHTS